MRFAKVPLLCLLLLVALAASPKAQFTCEDVTMNDADTLRIPFFCGKPGDTILVPVILDQDSIVTGFQFLIKFDTAWLKPVTELDSICIDQGPTECYEWSHVYYSEYVITGRMLKTDTTVGEFGMVIDTVNQFNITYFRGMEDVLACNQVSYGSLDSLPPGDDTIFYVKMVVEEDMPHLAYADFTFYESDVCYVDSSGEWPYPTVCNGCDKSQVASAWYQGQTQGGQDSTDTYQIYPKTNAFTAYHFQCDTLCTPPTVPDPTVALTANPSTITMSQNSSLSWTSTNADSVVVYTGLGSRLAGAQQGNKSGAITYTPTATGSYDFVARAYGENGNTALDYATVTVTGGGTGTGPTMSISGLQGSYDQGMPVSFSVTATGTSGQQITISSSNLPSGATFGSGTSQTGTTPVTGTFSWTPSTSQTGNYTVTFVGASPTGTTNLPVTIVINALKFDRLFSSSKAGNRPEGGRPGRAGIAFPINLVKLQDVYGVQFDMVYPDEYMRVDSFVTTARIPDYVVYDNIGSTPGTIRVVTFGLNSEPVIDTNTTAIMNAIITLDSSAVPWTDLVIHLRNGRESIDPDPLVGSKQLLTDSGLIVVDSLGDVNLDRYIDVADVVNIVAFIIGTHTLVDRQFLVADLISDEYVDVFDLVADVNMIYGISLPQPAPPAPDQVATLSLSYNDLTSGSTDLLKVTSEIPEEVAGVQLQLNYDPTALSLGTPRLTADVDGYALNSYDNGQGRLRILLYKFAPCNSGDFMQPGKVDLVEIPITAYKNVKADDKTRIRLTEGLMSTTVAGALTVEGIDEALPATFALHQNYPNPFNPTTTIMFEVGVSDIGAMQQEISLDIYNVLGQHVASLADGNYDAGVYRVVWDATSKDGRRVASGVYLYRLRVGGESITKKMLFLK